MKEQGWFSIGDFAKLARASKPALRLYDKIGLLSPVGRGNNKYRYYSISQLPQCNTIRVLHNLGLSLAEIKALLHQRTPEEVSGVLTRQIDVLDARTGNLMQARRLLHTIRQTIQSGMGVDEGAITIQRLPAAQIILGEPNDYSGGKTDYEALHVFYKTMHEKYSFSEYDTHYPVWGVFSAERIRRRDWRYPDRYYFYNPCGKDKRPAGLYAVGYMRAGYGQGAGLYTRILAFIEQNGFEVGGDAYEEYPLNEVAVADDSKYLMRVMIAVREK